MSLPSTADFSAIVIGGSAGSIKVVKDLLAQVTFTPQVPIIIGLHRAKTEKSSLVQVIQYATALQITEPSQEQRLLPGIVYLAPASRHLQVTPALSFDLSAESNAYYAYPSIDLLFSSAARVYGKKLIGILLTGATRDGAIGMQQIRQHGGLTIVQNPAECIGFTMPEAALKATPVDYVLGANDIGKLLNQLFAGSEKFKSPVTHR